MLLKPGILKKKFFLVLTVLLLASSASGAVYTNAWESEKKHDMKWGDKIKVDDYEIEFRDFSKNISMFYIYHNNFKEEIILSIGEGWNNTSEYKNLKIRLDETGKEKASITTWLLRWGPRDETLQKLFLNTSLLEFAEAGKSFNLRVEIENRGETLENASLRISSDYFILSKKEYFFPVLYSNITPVFLDIYAPFSFRDSADLNLSIEGWNKSDIYYINNLTKKMRIRSIEFSKSVYPEEVVLHSNRPNITIFLYLKNPTGENAHAFVEDASLNTTKEWFVNIGKGESKTIKYEQRPTQIGDIVLPPARAFVSAGGMSKIFYTNKSEVVVHGSIIYLKKELENNTVKVNIKNIGDATAFVRVKDVLSQDVEFINGSMEWEGIIQPLASALLEYSIAIKNESSVSLPPAIAQFTDSELNHGTTESNYVNVSFIEEESQINNETVVNNISIGTTESGNKSRNDNLTVNITDAKSLPPGMVLVEKHIPGFELYLSIAVFFVILARFYRSCTDNSLKPTLVRFIMF